MRVGMKWGLTGVQSEKSALPLMTPDKPGKRASRGWKSQPRRNETKTELNRGLNKMRVKNSTPAQHPALRKIALGILCSSSLLPILATAPAVAQEVDEIIVTGTRVANRTATESLAPIDVFSPADMEKQAFSDTNDILRTLVPSFNVSRNAISDGSTFVRPPTLRGLPPDQTLVLVNGKRRHRSALVQLGGGALAAGAQAPDLAQIPAIALKQVEVLRDGASAQYGSDAIAGVMNFQLKDAAEGGTAEIQYGSTYEGDGDNVKTAANVGLALGPNGFFNLSAEYSQNDPTNRGVQDPRAPATKKDLAMNWGSPDAEALRIVFNSGIDLTENKSIYLFGNYGRSKSNGSFFYRPPSTDHAVNGPVLPVAGDPDGFTFREWFPEGFTPRFYGDLRDASLVGGFKHELESGLVYNVSGSYGRSQLDYDLKNTVNPSLGPASPREFYVGRLVQEETSANIDLAYPVEIGLASPMNLAVGTEFHREVYEISPGDTASYTVGPYASYRDPVTGAQLGMPIGSNGYPGFRPEDSGQFARDNIAFYVDTETDITEAFTLGVAGRYEDFDYFGSTFNWKVSGRYELTDDFALRGSVNTGFRAPTPGQSQTSSVQTYFPAGSSSPVARGTYPAASTVAQYFGAKPLKEEESTNFAGGFVAKVADISLTADYYNIKVKDRIALSGDFNPTAADRTALAALGVPGANTLGAVNYFTNAFNTRTQGVDVVANTSVEVGDGKLDLTAAANYNKTKVIKRNASVIGDNRVADLEKQLPKVRGNFSAIYSIGEFSILGRASYYSKFTDTDNYAKTFGSEWLFDTEVSYTFYEQVTLSVGAQNLFDNYPDKLNKTAAGTYAVGQVYPDTSPIGYDGGTYYVRLKVAF
ncbi:iron complex outermembrane recepter protein [Azospirillum sp. RU38E]|nr:iron complex outermembrane recepter protein [Azospirillum sp. RU38E]SNT30939.1 iron complex outermembrane recepter protein [Azospirillum sp. RU37A]